MRYYIFISDSKVDMLLPQIPGALRKKVTSQLSIGFKIVKSSQSTETEVLEDRVARLTVVEKYIRSKEDVGAPPDSTPWLQGETNAAVITAPGGAIFFLAETSEWILALGGSTRHIVGDLKALKPGPSLSHLPRLVQSLRDLVERHPDYTENLTEESIRNYLGISVDGGFHAWAGIIKLFASYKQAPVQRVEFLARRLSSDTLGTQEVILATPLYVALAE